MSISDICSGVTDDDDRFAEVRGGLFAGRFDDATMNDADTPNEATDAMKRRLLELRSEHRDLDAAIAALEESGSFNPLQVQRLKKRKLSLRDQILRLESLLLPDIIA